MIIAIAAACLSLTGLMWACCRVASLADRDEERLIAELRARGIIPMEGN